MNTRKHMKISTQLGASLALMMAASISYAQTDFGDGDPQEPLWQATTPFSAEAIIARDGHLILGSYDSQSLRVASVDYNREGLAKTDDSVLWVTTVEESPHNFDGDPHLFATDLGWAFVGEREGKMTLLLESEPELSIPLLFTEVYSVVASADHVYVCGGLNKETAVAGATLKDGKLVGEPIYSIALPDKRGGAGTFMHEDSVYVVGGEAMLENGPMRPRSVYSAQWDQGTTSNWMMGAGLLPRRPGAIQLAKVNDVIVLSGNVHQTPKAETSTEHTLILGAFNLEDRLTPWMPTTTTIPAMENAVIAADESTNLFFLTGGETISDGVANLEIFAFPLPPSIKKQQESMSGNTLPMAVRDKVVLASYQAGLNRARERNAYHLAFLAEEKDQPAFDAMMNGPLGGIHGQRMLKGVIVSKASGEDVQALREKVGKETGSFAALLDEKGVVVSSMDGLPDLPKLVELLKPMWAPVPETTPTATGSAER